MGFCEDLSCCFVLLVVADEEMHRHGFFHVLHGSCKFMSLIIIQWSVD